MNTVQCLIQQANCSLTAQDPVCAKCGIDTRVRYVSEEAALLAKAQAEARFWKSEAEGYKSKVSKTQEATLEETIAHRQRNNVGEVFQDLPIAPQMVLIPRGKFLMGSAEADPDGTEFEYPQHEVTIDYALAIGMFPVTFAQWDACVAAGGVDYVPDDEGWGRGNRPVINVSWNDSQRYIAWLNKTLGLVDGEQARYCLPSEAEWEYACRAGSTGSYNTESGVITPEDATYDASRQSEIPAPHFGKKHDRTTPVGSYSANKWGLSDMHGNVCEWVQDCFDENYEYAPCNGDPSEIESSSRVLRGGSWMVSSESIGSTGRYDKEADTRDKESGFRLVKTLRRVTTKTIRRVTNHEASNWPFPTSKTP